MNLDNLDLWIVEHQNLVTTPHLDTTKNTLHKILSNYVVEKSLHITYNHHGKPMLENSNVCFSVTHTMNIMVVAVTHGIAVGVDIELATRKVHDPIAIAKRFFHEKELHYLDTALQATTFLELWTVKEAYVKMKGVGLKYGLDKFYVDTVQQTIVDIIDNASHGYNLLNLQNDYICGIVPHFKHVSLKTFSRMDPDRDTRVRRDDGSFSHKT